MIVGIPSCSFRQSPVPSGTVCSHPENSEKKLALESCVDCPLADFGIKKSGEKRSSDAKSIPAAPSGIGSMFRGLTGDIKAYIGLDESPKEVVSARHEICISCQHYNAGQCSICGCWIGPKIRLYSESCPIGKWKSHGDVQPTQQEEG